MIAIRSAITATVIACALTIAFAREQRPAPAPPPPPPPLPMPEILQAYRPVTADRLLKPDDGEWLMVRRTYDGWGYSPLDQITTANVARLQPAWVFATGATNGHEAPPLVNNGVMFVSTPGNQVIAVEAKTGRFLWRYRRPIPEDAIVMHPINRGVALYADKVFLAASEAVLVALDARTGKEVWTVNVADNQHGYYMSLAPLVAEGRVMIGASGGEWGIRGFVAAYDVATGKPAWRTYTVPAPGEPGSETWPKGDQWKTGGASVWVTANYDPETHLSYWGTGNGGPWMGDQRPGDNLYTSSTVALDVRTGRIAGHHQYHPNDSWDWDEVSPPILVDYERNGRTVKGLINVARNGYLWFLERSAGPISFVDGKPYVKQTVFRSLDPKTGRPDVDPDRKPATGKRADNICPSHWGGKNWPPIAFNPKTRMIYIPANENLCSSIIGREVQDRGRQDLHRRLEHPAAHARRRSHRRGPGMERRHRRPRLDPPLCHVDQLGSDAHDRRRARLQRRHQRSETPRLRRRDRHAPVGVSNQLRDSRATDVVHHRRQAVHRVAIGLGYGCARHAEPSQHADQR